MTTPITLSTDRAITSRRFEGFPVGYYDDIHPNPQMNYEMNRFSTGEADMIEEMRAVSPRIHDLSDYTREFLALGEAAFLRGEQLKGAYYIRGAEFCMFDNDPRKDPTRRRFVQLMRDQFDIADKDHFSVPYESSALSAYRMTPADSTGTLVIHGGFDTYIEEWFPMQGYFARAGLEVVIFDGPGQGSALHDGHLHFTPEWHKPVGAILDHFALDDITLLGISFGGCLALRAAAFEPRVRRVVADDTDTNHLEVMLGLLKPSVRAALQSLLAMGADHVVDRSVERAARESATTAFGVQQGMMVTGSKSPSAYLKQLRLYRTDDVSPLIEQDVLLLGGTEDFCIPRHMFHDQIHMLTSARSVTARLFTRHEQGQQHCQIGNLGLQFRVIKDWIEMLQERSQVDD